MKPWTEVYRLWGTGAGNSLNQSYHISHRRYPEPLVLAKRNAGSGYEIVLASSLVSRPLSTLQHAALICRRLVRGLAQIFVMHLKCGQFSVTNSCCIEISCHVRGGSHAVETSGRNSCVVHC